MPTPDPHLAALALHLRSRREIILAAWREAVKSDPRLTTADSLPRAQLNDHVPALLERFECRLDPPPAPAVGEAPDTQAQQAAAHGLHRWQQGYALAEVSRELGRLNECVVDELEAYAKAHRDLEPEVMATARRLWAELSGTEFSESIGEYFRLQQIEAAGHLHDLERALETIRLLEKERANLWHEAAHDLRGNLSAVVTATAGLTRPAIDEARRANFLRILDRSVGSFKSLLDDVTGLARLQAGKEQRQIAEVDAAALIADLCEALQADAVDRGLFLRFEGPAPFVVEGDAIKIRRMVQNLVINAVKYTRQGGVTVAWGDSAGNDGKRWMLSVEDTGPGFDRGPGAELVAALGEATDLARESEQPAAAEAPPAAVDSPAESLPEPMLPMHHEQGEGIGLSIVKRLAELLDSTVEVESNSASGTKFRLLLPRRY